MNLRFQKEFLYENSCNFISYDFSYQLAFTHFLSICKN